MDAKFEQALRRHGRSVTQSRRLLFAYFRREGAVSVKQFLDANSAIADRASLYRTLQLFREVGVVEERLVAGRRLVELTDAFDAHHHHLTCLHCGRSIDITMPEIETALVALCEQAGFRVERHVIEADGICTDCQVKLQSADV